MVIGFAAQAAISTANELRQRETERATPSAERHFTIGGTTQLAVDSEHALSSEQRIAKLRSSLTTAHERLQSDHVFSALKGRSKASFNHERE